MAQYPIPSYNVPVSYRACFEESTTNENPQTTSRGKRMMKIQSSCSGVNATICEAKGWVYSLDGLTVLGPFTLGCNETISVEIDEREWGVLIETDCDMNISVWIEEADLLKIANPLSS